MSGAENRIISDMVREVTELCDPLMIYLVSHKTNTSGELTSFKICVIVSDDSIPEQIEARLLLKTNCSIPCDFIVYTADDWIEHSEDDCSFAYRIENGGERLYVKG